jgi:predicted AAA+ superfamily ATPase
MSGLVPRQAHAAAIMARLKASPVVLLIGARQVGKSTLARQVMAGWRGATELFDLEDMRDRRRLSEPELVLERLRGLVHAGAESYPLGKNVRAVSAYRLLDELEPL